jgi:murein DD-endopeptidase MepM/ murein hydrolase activator NlpD
MFINRLMGAFLTSLLWLSLSAAGTGGKPVDAAAIDTDMAADKADEGPTTDEIDAALTSARRAFPIERAVPIERAYRSERDGLLLPVEGIAPAQLVDTFNASRSGGRSHNALDIMAPRGSLVVSATDGVVEQLHQSRLGGTTAYVRSTDGNWVYYYAHLDSYAPGLETGQRIRQGDPIGRVGSTGNADPRWPHLHFAMYRMAAGERWYQGRPIDPYPLLAGNARRR